MTNISFKTKRKKRKKKSRSQGWFRKGETIYRDITWGTLEKCQESCVPGNGLGFIQRRFPLKKKEKKKNRTRRCTSRREECRETRQIVAATITHIVKAKSGGAIKIAQFGWTSPALEHVDSGEKGKRRQNLGAQMGHGRCKQLQKRKQKPTAPKIAASSDFANPAPSMFSFSFTFFRSVGWIHGKSAIIIGSRVF